MFLPSLIQALIDGLRFQMTAGEQTRDFIYIDDVVNSVIRSLESNSLRKGQIINISSGSPILVKILTKLVAQLIGKDSLQLIDFGTLDYRSGEALEYWALNSRANELLNWSPCMTLEGGLAKTIEYFVTPG